MKVGSAERGRGISPLKSRAQVIYFVTHTRELLDKFLCFILARKVRVRTNRGLSSSSLHRAVNIYGV